MAKLFQFASFMKVYASRKRKFLDGGSASGKLLGSSKPSVFLRSTDDDPLHTPQCSQSGKLFRKSSKS